MRTAKEIFEEVLNNYEHNKRTVNNEYGWRFDKMEAELQEEVKQLREEFDLAIEQEGW